jgi:hypothetical protein
VAPKEKPFQKERFFLWPQIFAPNYRPCGYAMPYAARSACMRAVNCRRQNSPVDCFAVAM